MNDNAKRWVAALRSGEFQQTQGRLRRRSRDGYGYCCLGVACELYARAHPDKPSWQCDESAEMFRGQLYDLPFSVRRWLGLATPEGACCPAAGPTTLAVLNDDGATFAEIADLIESEPEGLFT